MKYNLLLIALINGGFAVGESAVTATADKAVTGVVTNNAAIIVESPSIEAIKFAARLKALAITGAGVLTVAGVTAGAVIATRQGVTNDGITIFYDSPITLSAIQVLNISQIALACYTTITPGMVGKFFRCFDRANSNLTTVYDKCNVAQLNMLLSNNRSSYLCGNSAAGYINATTRDYVPSVINQSECMVDTTECYDIKSVPVISCKLSDDGALCGGERVIHINGVDSSRVIGLGVLGTNVTKMIASIPPVHVCYNVSFLSNGISMQYNRGCYLLHTMRTTDLSPVLVYNHPYYSANESICVERKCTPAALNIPPVVRNTDSLTPIFIFNQSKLIGLSRKAFNVRMLDAPEFVADINYLDAICNMEPVESFSACYGNITCMTVPTDPTATFCTDDSLLRMDGANIVNVSAGVSRRNPVIEAPAGWDFVCHQYANGTIKDSTLFGCFNVSKARYAVDVCNDFEYGKVLSAAPATICNVTNPYMCFSKIEYCYPMTENADGLTAWERLVVLAMSNFNSTTFPQGIYDFSSFFAKANVVNGIKTNTTCVDLKPKDQKTEDSKNDYYDWKCYESRKLRPSSILKFFANLSIKTLNTGGVYWIKSSKNGVDIGAVYTVYNKMILFNNVFGLISDLELVTSIVKDEVKLAPDSLYISFETSIQTSKINYTINDRMTKIVSLYLKYFATVEQNYYVQIASLFSPLDVDESKIVPAEYREQYDKILYYGSAASAAQISGAIVLAFLAGNFLVYL